MSTLIFYSDSNKQPNNLIDIPDGNLNNQLAIPFIGNGAWFSYGNHVNTTLLRLVENFADDLPQTKTTEGQAWYNNKTNVLNISTVIQPYQPPVPNPTLGFTIPEDPEVREWVGVGEVPVTTAPPQSTSFLWYDTTTSLLKYFDGSEWSSVAERYLLTSGGTLTGPVTIDQSFINPTTTEVDVLTNNGTLTVDNFMVDPFSTQTHLDSLANSSFVHVNRESSQFDSGNSHKFSFYNLIRSDSGIIFNLDTDDDESSSSTLLKVNNNDVIKMTTMFSAFFQSVDASDNKIIDLQPPTAAKDAARYDELQYSSTEFSKKIERAGDTGTGTIITPKLDITASKWSQDIVSFGGTSGKITGDTLNTYIYSNNNPIFSVDLHGEVRDHQTPSGNRAKIANVSYPFDNTDALNKVEVDTSLNDVKADIQSDIDKSALPRGYASIYVSTGGAVPKDHYNANASKIGGGLLSYTVKLKVNTSGEFNAPSDSDEIGWVISHTSPHDTEMSRQHQEFSRRSVDVQYVNIHNDDTVDVVFKLYDSTIKRNNNYSDDQAWDTNITWFSGFFISDIFEVAVFW